MLSQSLRLGYRMDKELLSPVVIMRGDNRQLLVGTGAAQCHVSVTWMWVTCAMWLVGKWSTKALVPGQVRTLVQVYDNRHTVQLTSPAHSEGDSRRITDGKRQQAGADMHPVFYGGQNAMVMMGRYVCSPPVRTHRHLLSSH